MQRRCREEPTVFDPGTVNYLSIVEDLLASQFHDVRQKIPVSLGGKVAMVEAIRWV